MPTCTLPRRSYYKRYGIYRCVIFLGVLFILSAFSVIVRSSEAIKDDVKPAQVRGMLYLMGGLLTVVQFNGKVSFNYTVKRGVNE